ncbi:GNAT family N-acetyltransferase [Halobacillus sp. A1]|uniref:GNAT family N-acetyltransferase n=1 Tax=Halobacillus sp. A1 TaxID=2880262 RepID=UPI0020A6D455|nr:GNAT family N-acetyltransferase [Halobacillus sp. A1]MCP3033031.1 GNAT family N-acetyltransferase [Halobacillus sp. A1]
MKIVRHYDLNKFRKLMEPLLMENEAENNLLLGLMRNPPPSNTIMLSIQEGTTVVYGIMRTPPHLWILPSIPHLESRHIEKLSQFFIENDIEVPGAIGEKSAVELFLRAWHGITKTNFRLHMRQGVYKLRSIKTSSSERGRLIQAKHEDTGWLVEWFQQYYKQIGETSQIEKAEETTVSLVGDEKVYFYRVDGENVSMVSRARSTPNGDTINGVFTPDNHKRKGYATEAVTLLTEKLLREGSDFCALYTDLSNETSNSIYTKIGYEKVGESLVYHFLDEKTLS